METLLTSYNSISILTSLTLIAIIANRITIIFSNLKGKEKACNEKDEIEVDTINVPLPGEADMEDKLEEYCKETSGEKENQDSV